MNNEERIGPPMSDAERELQSDCQQLCGEWIRDQYQTGGKFEAEDLTAFLLARAGLIVEGVQVQKGSGEEVFVHVGRITRMKANSARPTAFQRLVLGMAAVSNPLAFAGVSAGDHIGRLVVDLRKQNEERELARLLHDQKWDGGAGSTPLEDIQRAFAGEPVKAEKVGRITLISKHPGALGVINTSSRARPLKEKIERRRKRKQRKQNRRK